MRAIDADVLKKYFFRPYSNEESYSNIDLERIIDAQPTIEPERKKGKWINAQMNRVIPNGECSECHKWNAITNFCPNCGADNRRDEE